MKFFLPVTQDPDRADYLWNGARALLADAGFPTELRRIHSLFYRRGGEARVQQVGLEDGDTGEPVMLILRAADAPYYWVCTPACGILAGAPIPVPEREVRLAVEFEP